MRKRREICRFMFLLLSVTNIQMPGLFALSLELVHIPHPFLYLHPYFHHHPPPSLPKKIKYSVENCHKNIVRISFLTLVGVALTYMNLLIHSFSVSLKIVGKYNFGGQLPWSQIFLDLRLNTGRFHYLIRMQNTHYETNTLTFEFAYFTLILVLKMICSNGKHKITTTTTQKNESCAYLNFSYSTALSASTELATDFNNRKVKFVDQ